MHESLQIFTWLYFWIIINALLLNGENQFFKERQFIMFVNKIHGKHGLNSRSWVWQFGEGERLFASPFVFCWFFKFFFLPCETLNLTRVTWIKIILAFYSAVFLKSLFLKELWFGFILQDWKETFSTDVSFCLLWCCTLSDATFSTE